MADGAGSASGLEEKLAGLSTGGGGEECMTQSECQGCYRLFCARCTVPWHAGGVSCEEFAHLGEGEHAWEDLVLVEAAREGNWKRYP